MARLILLRTVVLAVLAIVVVRLAYLQLVQGARYRRLADENRLRLVPEQAARGPIVDRHGRLLAGNQTVFRVAVIPQEVEDLSGILDSVSPLVDQPVARLERTLRREQVTAFVPATMVSHVPKEVALRIEEALWRHPGLMVKPETVRRYPLGPAAAHLVGYLSEPTAEELPRLKQYGVRPRHLVGRAGLEQSLDLALRGRSGGVMVEVNNRGRQVRVIGGRPADGGSRVELSVDAALQSLITQAFGNATGASVVLDPDTGEILAMVSVPGFDPEDFALQESEGIQRWLSDARAPLMNRATVGLYAPGSTVKVAVAAAALTAGVVSPETTIVCPGAMQIGDRTFRCWNEDGHGPMRLVEALHQSCNIYFMRVARRLGADRLRQALAEVGFAQRTGWPGEERAGQLPRGRMTEGEVAILGLGQGEILVTVLQAARLAAAFANGGWLVDPWVVRGVGPSRTVGRVGRRRLPWSGPALAAVRHGMQEVVANPWGTGRRAFSPSVGIAGKTGTAQTHVPDQPHGWFIGFCPVEQPRVAMGIVAEHGGSGGDLPATIARAICEYVSLGEAL